MNNIKEYLYGKLPWLINNYNNPDEISRILYERLQSNFNYNGNQEMTITKIKEIIELYKTNPNSIDSIVDNFCDDLRKYENSNIKSNISNSNVSNTSTQTSTSGQKKVDVNNTTTESTLSNSENHPDESTSAIITSSTQTSTNGQKNIDIDNDTLDQVLNDYKVIQEERSENVITTDGYVTEVFNQYQTAIETKEVEIEALIQEIGTETISFLQEVEAIDNTTASLLTNDDISFSELLGIYSMYKQTGSKIVEADANVFIKAGYTVNNGIVSIVDKNGVKYEYNISSNLLKDSNGNALTVKYYLPSNYSDLSSLNTVTCLGGQGEGSMYEMTGGNSFYLGDISTNSMLIMPKKKKQSGTDINKASYSYMSSDVIAGTMFATLFSKQNSDCQNSIIGCSSGGGSALKIAAQSGDLYDNVISVNYAAIFQGDGKGINPGDDNRLTESEVRNLNGKNLVFISTSMDSNLNGEKNSYVYKGLNRILNSCPDADVTFITNNTSKIYTKIDNDNYHYFGKDSDFWRQNLGNYGGHGDYHKVFRDIINSDILSVNSSYY